MKEKSKRFANNPGPGKGGKSRGRLWVRKRRSCTFKERGGRKRKKTERSNYRLEREMGAPTRLRQEGTDLFKKKNNGEGANLSGETMIAGEGECPLSGN